MRRYRHWRNRGKWIPEESVSYREAATRGKTTKAIRNIEHWRDMYRRQGFNCEIDHIRPLSMGGEHVVENMWIVMKYLNSGGPQHLRSEEMIQAALKAAAQDRTKLYETWPNS